MLKDWDLFFISASYRMHSNYGAHELLPLCQHSNINWTPKMCHIYAPVNWVIVDSDDGLSPNQRQTIFWTNADLLAIWPLGTNFSEICIEIQDFSFKKMHLKMSFAKWQPFCLTLKVLRICTGKRNCCQYTQFIYALWYNMLLYWKDTVQSVCLISVNLKWELSE